MSVCQVTSSGVPVRAGVYDLDDGFEGLTATGVSLYHAPTTPEIAHDASASDVEAILETLPSLGQVCLLYVLSFSVGRQGKVLQQNKIAEEPDTNQTPPCYPAYGQCRAHIRFS